MNAFHTDRMTRRTRGLYHRVTASVQGASVRIWFWAWMIVAVGIAVASALARDRYSAPWATGAVAAAGLEAARAPLAWQWIAFLAVSAIVFVAVNRARYAGRHIARR
jgi:membrane protein implicated in regulation of membrane protease activity